MKKMEKFKKKYYLSVEAKAEQDKKIADQQSAIDKIEEKIDEAATSGDFDLFQKLKEEKRVEEDRMIVLKASFRRPPLPTIEDAVDAWEDYCKEYEIEFDKKYGELQKARQAVYDTLMELAKCQNAALKERELVADLCGIEYHYSTFQPVDLDSFPVRKIVGEYESHRPFLFKMPEGAYLFELGIIKSAERPSYDNPPDIDRLDLIFRLGKSVDQL